MEKRTWYVVGINNGEQKTVTIKAASKTEAIEKGLEKIGAKTLIDCKLKLN
jgi:hypothetical protein